MRRALTILLLCSTASVAMGQSVAGLAELSTRQATREKLLSEYPRERVIEALAKAIKEDPVFRPDTEAGGEAILLLCEAAGMSVPGGEGVTSPEAIRAIADVLEQARPGEQVKILIMLDRVSVSLRPTIAPAVGRLIAGSTHKSVLVGAMRAAAELRLPIDEAAHARIRSLALRENPDDPVWTSDAVVVRSDIDFFHADAVGVYLWTQPTDLARWEAVAKLEGEWSSTAFRAAWGVAVGMCHLSQLEDPSVVDRVFDTLIELGKKPGTQFEDSGNFVRSAARAIRKAGPSSDAFAKGVARMTSELQKVLSKEHVDGFTELLRLYASVQGKSR
jgi:hypothetical protein